MPGVEIDDGSVVRVFQAYQVTSNFKPKAAGLEIGASDLITGGTRRRSRNRGPSDEYLPLHRDFVIVTCAAANRVHHRDHRNPGGAVRLPSLSLHVHATYEVRTMSDHDQLIDPIQVELLIEEIRYCSLNEDERARELIALYRFQQQLCIQWQEEEWRNLRGG